MRRKAVASSQARSRAIASSHSGSRRSSGSSSDSDDLASSTAAAAAVEATELVAPRMCLACAPELLHAGSIVRGVEHAEQLLGRALEEYCWTERGKNELVRFSNALCDAC